MFSTSAKRRPKAAICEFPHRRLIHTSDLHLDDLSNRRHRGLALVVDLAVRESADAILIAGDFFDSNRVSDAVVDFAIRELGRFNGPTIIVAGNHDCLTEDSVYNRHTLWDSAPRVHVMRTAGGETLELKHLGLSIWGQSLTSYGGDMEPFAAMPNMPTDNQWHIAIGHGYAMPPNGRDWASFQISSCDLEKSQRHYVALGDCHAYRCISDEPVKAYYSGAPSSGSHTVAVVDLVSAQCVDVSAHSLRVRYTDEHAEMTGHQTGHTEPGCPGLS
jgi:DNA repair exonuclease SbcCD nuclease subunit